MKRNLLKQIRNEWKDNVWLVIELTVVALAIWGLLFIIYISTRGLYMPRGFDPDNVYTLSVRWIGEESPEYVSGPNGEAYDFRADRLDLIRRLRENPYVEAVGIHKNGMPYNYNYNGSPLGLLDITDSVEYSGNRRVYSPEMVKVLRFKSLTGKSEDQLMDALERGDILISDDETYTQMGRDPKDLIGKRVIIGSDTAKVYTVADVVQNVRRSDYEPGWRGVIFQPMSEEKNWSSGMALRVKPGKGKAFEESFKADKSLQRQHNVYLTDLTSLANIREGCQRSMDVQVRMWYVVAVFLLITIFLGLLGSFWFRMQQRVSEIAIRKVSGASRNQIFRRVITEGLLLLMVAVIIASVILWPFVIAGKFDDYGASDYKMVLILEAVMAAIIALGIVVSLWYPARRAMSIEPAIAIKAE